MKEEKVNNVPYIVHEGEVARQERHIKRLIAIILILIGLLFASNMAWLYVWNSYDYTTDTQTVDLNSQKGNANYIENGGEILNAK